MFHYACPRNSTLLWEILHILGVRLTWCLVTLMQMIIFELFPRLWTYNQLYILLAMYLIVTLISSLIKSTSFKNSFWVLCVTWPLYLASQFPFLILLPRTPVNRGSRFLVLSLIFREKGIALSMCYLCFAERFCVVCIVFSTRRVLPCMHVA
jgi:hypothetical protein